MSNQKPTLPSEQLQSVLNLFEKHLKNGVLSDKSLPEWYVMATALVTAHAAFERSGQINVMFDATNSFDVAMLVWVHRIIGKGEAKNCCGFRARPETELGTLGFV